MQVKTLQRKTLKDLKPLTEKVAVYIPSTYNVNEKIDSSAYVRRVMSLFSMLFGGSTAMKAQGAWMSDEKGLVVEDITVVYSYTDKLNDDIISDVLDICELIKQEMKQECVSLEINDQLYFV